MKAETDEPIPSKGFTESEPCTPLTKANAAPTVPEGSNDSKIFLPISRI